MHVVLKPSTEWMSVETYLGNPTVYIYRTSPTATALYDASRPKFHWTENFWQAGTQMRQSLEQSTGIIRFCRVFHCAYVEPKRAEAEWATEYCTRDMVCRTRSLGLTIQKETRLSGLSGHSDHQHCRCLDLHQVSRPVSPAQPTGIMLGSVRARFKWHGFV